MGDRRREEDRGSWKEYRVVRACDAEAYLLEGKRGVGSRVVVEKPAGMSGESPTVRAFLRGGVAYATVC